MKMTTGTKLYLIKTIKCRKKECVFLDHLGEDIPDNSQGLVLCLICEHSSWNEKKEE